MKLAVADPGFGDFDKSQPGCFLGYIGSVLCQKPFKGVDKLVIVNFEKRVAVDEELLQEFKFVPLDDNTDISDGQRIEGIIKEAKLLSEHELSKIGQTAHETIVFYAELFPAEFIPFFNGLESWRREFILFENNVSIENFDVAEEYIKHLKKVKPVYDEIYDNGKLPSQFYLDLMKKTLLTLSTDEESKHFTTDFVEILKNIDLSDEYDLIRNHQDSSVFKMQIQQRMDIYFQLSENLADNELDKETQRRILEKVKKTNLIKTLIEEFGSSKKEAESLLSKITVGHVEKPDLKRNRFNRMIDAAYSELIDSIIPNYLFECLDSNKARYFYDIKNPPVKFLFIKGKEKDLVKYIIEDSLREEDERSKIRLTAREINSRIIDVKTEFLIVSDFETLDNDLQVRTWNEFLKCKDNFKAVIFCCAKGKIIEAATGHPEAKLIYVPSYADMKTERYRIFLQLINQKIKINKKSIDVLPAIAFYYKKFDDYLKTTENFDQLERTVNEVYDYIKEIFEFRYLLNPMFWFLFDGFLKDIREDVNELTSPKHSNKNWEYRVERKMGHWVVYCNNITIMVLKPSPGLDFMFYLLNDQNIKREEKEKREEKGEVEQKGILAHELYKIVMGEKAENPTAIKRINKNNKDAVTYLKKEIAKHAGESPLEHEMRVKFVDFFIKNRILIETSKTRKKDIAELKKKGNQDGSKNKQGINSSKSTDKSVYMEAFNYPIEIFLPKKFRSL